MTLGYLMAQIPDQPIIVARLTADFTLADNASFYRDFAELAAQFEGPYYRIVDMYELRIDLEDVLSALAATAEGTPGSASDPRVVKNFYAGLGERAKPVRAKLEQQGRQTFRMIFVGSLEQALNIIFAEMDDPVVSP